MAGDTLPNGNSLEDVNRLMAIMNPYAKKNFVKRILYPDQWPKMDLGEGQYATHKMAWGSTDNEHMVYPTVIYDDVTGKLKELAGDEAFQHAMTTGEYIPFKTPQEADWFSKNYKKVWTPPLPGAGK